MKNIILGLPLLFLSMQPVNAENLQSRVFAYWIAEVEYLDTICGEVSISESAKHTLLNEAGISQEDLQTGGGLFSPYLFASTNAHDKFAELSPRDACFHLKNMIGEEGYLISGMLEGS